MTHETKLVWHKGPFFGGDTPEPDGCWKNYDALLIAVAVPSNPLWIQLVSVFAEEGHVDFQNADGHIFYEDEIEWWAKLDSSNIPPFGEEASHE